MVVVIVVILDETPAVHVNHVALAAGAEEVEAADALPECRANLASNFFLIGAETRDVANLLAMRVASHDAIHHGRFSRLCVAVRRPNRVCLDVFSVIHVHEAFVDEA